jgi:hypothetical protein
MHFFFFSAKVDLARALRLETINRVVADRAVADGLIDVVRGGVGQVGEESDEASALVE